ncbi:MAG: hypothetical protein KAH77_04525, partial [Thiomargarita sp.]|nr:hypothetical protein [Thiomargarita sp.]
MNPQDKETAKGNIPIQFEAIAPGQTGILEVIYFNPAGIKDSDEDTVRYDLARWLASIATWWPEFGLGAKRLAGYGAIEIQDATLQAVDWSNMLETNEEKIASQEPQLEKPDRYEKYLDENSELLSQEAFDTALQTKMVKKETEIATLQTQWNKEQRGKQKKKIKKILDSATNKKNTLEELEKSQYKKADDYWQQSHVDIHQTTEEPADIKKELPIEERTERGEDSWIKLARWIAGEKD